jgi:hypothetical protein
MPTKTKLTRMSRSKRVPSHIRGNIKNSKYEIKRKTKTATMDLKNYKKNLDAQMKVIKDKRKNNMAEIEMAHVQNSTIYLTLLQLMLMGTEKSTKMAQDYAIKANIDFSMLRQDSRNPKMARKVGSMRIKSKSKKKPNSLATMVGKKLKIKTMANKKYYKNATVPGDRLMGSML